MKTEPDRHHNSQETWITKAHTILMDKDAPKRLLDRIPA